MWLRPVCVGMGVVDRCPLSSDEVLESSRECAVDTMKGCKRSKQESQQNDQRQVIASSGIATDMAF